MPDLSVPDAFFPHRPGSAIWQSDPDMGLFRPLLLHPRFVFFSGGTALKPLARRMARHGGETTHLITAFDSGGSTAELRRVFAMPGIGDYRNRLLAVADRDRVGKGLLDFLDHRLPAGKSRKKAREEYAAICRGSHPLFGRMGGKEQGWVADRLERFAADLPDDFDFRNASLGNLVMTGAYLSENRNLAAALEEFAFRVCARSSVLAVSASCRHLVAECRDGRFVVGQHRITRGDAGNVPIRKVFLAKETDAPVAAATPADPRVLKSLQKADLICYPVGSFFTSVVASLLPEGIGEAIARSSARKVLIPNTISDPECRGLSLMDQVRSLLSHLENGQKGRPNRRYLDTMVLDTMHVRYPGGVDRAALERMGIRVVTAPLVRGKGDLHVDPDRMEAALLSLL